MQKSIEYIIELNFCSFDCSLACFLLLLTLLLMSVFFHFDSGLALGLDDKIGNFEVKSVSTHLSARHFCKTLTS